MLNNQELITKIVKNPNWNNLFLPFLEKYQINTKPRICHYFAQILHECQDLKCLEENLYYSKEGLLANFKKYFDEETAILFQKNPQKIANRIYANRMGNGNEQSGDGYRFRGRGIIQLTGKENYVKHKLEKNPDILLTDKNLAIEVSCKFWQENKLNILADKNDITGITKKINGGNKGLDDREARLARYINL